MVIVPVGTEQVGAVVTLTVGATGAVLTVMVNGEEVLLHPPLVIVSV